MGLKTSVEKKPGVQLADGRLKHPGPQSLLPRVAGLCGIQDFYNRIHLT